MILNPQDKVLVVHRRLFEGDHGRFFLGFVDEYEHGIVRVTGYTIAREAIDGLFIRKADRRTKIVSIASGTMIVYQLAKDLDIETVKIVNRDAKLILSDGRGFEMNLTEHAYAN